MNGFLSWYVEGIYTVYLKVSGQNGKVKAWSSGVKFLDRKIRKLRSTRAADKIRSAFADHVYSSFLYFTPWVLDLAIDVHGVNGWQAGRIRSREREEIVSWIIVVLQLPHY